MFLLVSVRHVGAHPDGHHYDVSIQISINFVKTFLRISPIRNIPLAWILARVFAYLPPFYFPDSGLYLLKAFDFYFDLFWMGEDKRWTRCPWTPSLDRVHGPLSVRIYNRPAKSAKELGPAWQNIAGKSDIHGQKESGLELFRSRMHFGEIKQPKTLLISRNKQLYI